MKLLYDEAQLILAEFDDARIEHNFREKNELADMLANLAMDRRTDVTEVPGGRGAGATKSTLPLDEPSAVAPKAGDQFECPRCGCEMELRAASRIRPHQLKPFACQCGAKMNAK